MDILGKLKWPLKVISKAVATEVEDKARIATQTAIAELPDVVNDLLDGKPVDVVMTIQLKRKT